MVFLPQMFTLDPWGAAWSTAEIGVEAAGLRPYFLNSLYIVVPAVLISTLLGAINGYVLTQGSSRVTRSCSASCCSLASSHSRSC